ncbi:MAG: putative Zn-dependent peptidase [Flavobacteriales bacterium]|jgi:predicted Zn-dependent peptidase
MQEFHTFTLPNGLRCIHKETTREVSHCGLIVNAGSRDEQDHEQGLAHFIEHSIFKGTKKRKTFHILNRLDRVGGEINAYTTKEETWVYASFLNAHFERAVELIGDICFNSTFPAKEIEKEKDVIIDEINSYLDSPAEMIFDEFEDLIYEGHPLGVNILGTEQSVKKFTRQDIFNLVGRRYTADNMVFSSVGNMPIAKVKKLAEKHLGHFESKALDNVRKPFTTYVPRELEQVKNVFQTHCIIGSETMGNDDDRKMTLALLNNYLGGPAMNSRLSLSIREKHGYTYNIESNYTAYGETGNIQIYLGTDNKFLSKTLKLVDKELELLRTKKLGTTQLRDAQQQMIGQLALSQDSGVGTMLALGKSYMLYDRVDPLSEVFARIQRISANEIMEIANEVFDPKKLSRLLYRAED